MLVLFKEWPVGFTLANKSIAYAIVSLTGSPIKIRSKTEKSINRRWVGIFNEDIILLCYSGHTEIRIRIIQEIHQTLKTAIKAQ
jgi:hypothetical protein